MRVLVAIANYGTKNQRYLDKVLATYDAVPFDVDIAVLSNVEKDLGAGVEVRVGLPSEDPWSLPFGHKQLFAERQDDYDLFIYSEDDTLVTLRNIEAFLEATEELPRNKIAGFLRYEENSQGHRFCSSMHSHYHWRPGSLCRHGSDFYAYYTNMHSACFILTRRQLKDSIASGGFLVPPHEGRYDLLCTAATDPYTQCGLEKLICVSRIDDFLLHHLPNQYLGRLGLPFEEMRVQINRMLKLGNDCISTGLIPEETGLGTWRYEKHYYGGPDESLLRTVPGEVTTVLSIGCGQGESEKLLMGSGRKVDGIPLDSYISALAEMRGVRCLPADWPSLFAMPAEQKYDLVLLSDLLCYVDDPVRVLRACREHITPCGVVLVNFINRLYLGRRRLTSRHRAETVQYHHCDKAMVKRWLNASGWRMTTVHANLTGRKALLHRVFLGLLANRLSDRISVVASPR